jgi:hypothetical protein
LGDGYGLRSPFDAWRNQTDVLDTCPVLQVDRPRGLRERNISGVLWVAIRQRGSPSDRQRFARRHQRRDHHDYDLKLEDDVRHGYHVARNDQGWVIVHLCGD